MAALQKVGHSAILKSLEGLLGASEPYRAASGKVAAIADAVTSARERVAGCASVPETEATERPAHDLMVAVGEASNLVNRWVKERRSLRRFSRNGKQWNDSWASTTSQISTFAIAFCKACGEAASAAEPRPAVGGTDPPSVTHGPADSGGAHAEAASTKPGSTHPPHAEEEVAAAREAVAAARAEEEAAAAREAAAAALAEEEEAVAAREAAAAARAEEEAVAAREAAAAALAEEEEASAAHEAAAAARAEEEEAAAAREAAAAALAEEEEAAAAREAAAAACAEEEAVAAREAAAAALAEEDAREPRPSGSQDPVRTVRSPLKPCLGQRSNATENSSIARSKAAPVHPVSEDAIRARAFGIWQQSGRSDAVANWYAALQELRAAV
ncbi:hypothetical protein FNF29_00079 [Cafeteria roenbergensis]|uniref:Uncharacterized protein n=1 Tax=Cafeteria roenbergensis TaxID=33653 RepID=A0A5A8CWF9_CAFRO|nr:hypothetical protein FNF29_00079 [Cafeteria roenbergensis]|eukprot:KAA0157503.1 hypothetical protein FNF29_00079 [Cafeteria roenbergensis]